MLWLSVTFKHKYCTTGFRLTKQKHSQDIFAYHIRVRGWVRAKQWPQVCIKEKHDYRCVFITFCPWVLAIYVVFWGGDPNAICLVISPRTKTIARGQHQTSFVSCGLHNTQYVDSMTNLPIAAVKWKVCTSSFSGNKKASCVKVVFIIKWLWLFFFLEVRRYFSTYKCNPPIYL